jgi:DNA-binding YbaB/EbfC family protein
MNELPEGDEMSENPFGEGFDMNALLQQAQAMQEQLMSAQAELAGTTVDGTVGGGLVTATVNGTGELVGVQVKAGSFDPDDPDSLADLGDLVVAAYRDAKSRADALAQEKLGPMAGGLGALGGPGGADPGAPGLPGGFGV